ncbi:Uncharacterised protein [Streptococcus pneumoniae]|nr:Uncharacterised protein [Streptococcus pneumoniae]
MFKDNFVLLYNEYLIGVVIVNMKNVKNDVEFAHNGKVFPARVDTYFYNGKKMGDTLVFTYTGVNVSMHFSDEDAYHIIAKQECILIDKLGAEEYRVLDRYRKRVKEIEESHVVINDKVYNHYYDNSVRSGATVYHEMMLQMKDGETIDGTSPSQFFYDEDRKNRVKTFYNLTNKVTKYCRENKTEPKDSTLNLELTQEYKEKSTWINERNN